MIEVRGQQDPNTLKLTKPTLRFTYDAFLALHEANRMRATGDSRIRPLAEVEAVDYEWENDTFTALDLLKYLEDYNNNLDPTIKALLEREQQGGEGE